MKNLEAAVTLTNQSEFANGSCLYTSNASAIRYFRENVDAGMLGINLGVPAPMAWFAFPAGNTLSMVTYTPTEKTV